MRFSVYDFRAEDGRDVLAGRPPYVPDLARQDARGIDVGMCPVCKQGGMPRRWNGGAPRYFPHASRRGLCRAAMR